MKRRNIIGLLVVSVALLSGCADNDVIGDETLPADVRELQGIEAVIDHGTGVTRAERVGYTRASAVTPLADYVGRSEFKGGDEVVFTEIRRTAAPIVNFTYPDGTYSGIFFKAGNEGGWAREIIDATHEPERVYWTDAVSDHTFIAYGIPQVNGYDWKPYQFTQAGTQKTYYIGSLGDPTLTGTNDIIDYDIDPYAKDANDNYLYRKKVNNDSIFTNPTLENEDLVIAYDTEMQAEPGGSVALVKFHHALSSIRVVVNISGFSSSSSAADNNTKVSNMRLLHQPMMYIWEQSKWGAEPMRATAREGMSATDQQMINTAWGGSGPAFDQRKDIRLWIPHPEGVGTNQSKTFTFYGITTPQPFDYISTLPTGSDYRKAELKFDVTYPDPLKPSTLKTHTYTAMLVDNPATTEDENVYFEAGYNTTINISLNHRNEQMTVGAEYENWQFVATPDIGQLKKNSTFLQDLDRTSITIVGDAKATIDDATWLYDTGEKDANNNAIIKDIYGHTGNSENDAYQISTAYQLLSFAYEVTGATLIGTNNPTERAGNDFTGKYIRLDADITLQSTSDRTKEEIDEYIYENGTQKDNPEYKDSNVKSALNWIGIGDGTHVFNGTFLGGKRFIYRLKGNPLFYSLGSNAKIEQLQVSTITLANNTVNTTAGGMEVTGNGLFANTNAGLICACKVVGDVTFDGSTVGAFVGTNESTGKIFASYHIGATMSTSDEGTVAVGGLAGSNNGIISSCYHAGKVSGKSGTTTGGITASNTGTLYNNYFNSTLLTPTFVPESGIAGKTTNEMTKQAFVNEINAGITTWTNNNSGYDNHSYNYQPANYPKLN